MHGHVAPRKTKGVCVECMKLEWQRGNETRAGYFAEYNKSEAGQKAKQRYYEANREYVIAKARSTPNELKNKYRKVWAEKNPLSILANNKVRRRKHRDATPPWLTRTQKSEIRALYQAAILSSQTTGERYVVDHIWPLRSDVVCGLHVPWNLRIITQKQNLEKSNKLPDDLEALAFPPRT
jgi:5-methylcytosine-specific restriction endonuclease McrA